ncbi:MAG TPA: ABC transporter ATP-binding protein [Methylococcaceae bacterium]|nr:ABC transporter ATP-binding protein [Methylococcaceae bacterium]
MEAAIRVEGLCFEYPGVKALQDVSFTVAAGSVTALVGPNGAGKTTLLRCLAGLEPPFLGRISLAGVDVSEEPRACHRRVGYLSDFFGLYEALSVRRALQYAALSHGVDAEQAETAVVQTAEALELAERLESRCGELSRGMRQRVAIGQAIIHRPDVLLLDEPASGLDPEARHSLAGLFRRLQAEGLTLVVSSHILAELDEYSTDMLVLRGGRVVEHRPLSEAAAGQAARQVRIALARPVADWPAALSSFLPAGAHLLESGATDALLALPGDAAASATLLRELVLAGLPVAGFAEERQNLQESYLRTVHTTIRAGEKK